MHFEKQTFFGFTKELKNRNFTERTVVRALSPLCDPLKPYAPMNLPRIRDQNEDLMFRTITAKVLWIWHLDLVAV